MKTSFKCILLILCLPFTVSGQTSDGLSSIYKKLDTLKIDKAIQNIGLSQKAIYPIDKRVILTMQAIDKCIDSVVVSMGYKPLKFTVFQTLHIYIEKIVDDRKTIKRINPILFQNQFQCKHILFNSKELHATIRSLKKTTKRKNRKQLYGYLENTVDSFSFEDKRVEAQPIRIRTITFIEDSHLVFVGIDIYGAHYEFVFDMDNSWNLNLVEELWVY